MFIERLIGWKEANWLVSGGEPPSIRTLPCWRGGYG
jgi:hypothetical protein